MFINFLIIFAVVLALYALLEIGKSLHEIALEMRTAKAQRERHNNDVLSELQRINTHTAEAVMELVAIKYNGR